MEAEQQQTARRSFINRLVNCFGKKHNDSTYEQASKPSPKIYTHIKNVGILLQGHTCVNVVLKSTDFLLIPCRPFSLFYSFLILNCSLLPSVRLSIFTEVLCFLMNDVVVSKRHSL